MLFRAFLKLLAGYAAMAAFLCSIGLGIALIVATVYHSLRVMGVVQ